MASNKKRRDIPQTEIPTQDIEEIEETVETTTEELLNEWTSGVVSDCEKLRIRDDAEGEILTVVEKGTKLKFQSTNIPDWHEVLLEDGTAGYAMSAYIKEI